MSAAESDGKPTATMLTANVGGTTPATSDFVAGLSARVRRAVNNRRASYRSPHLRRGYMMQFQEIERAVSDELRRCTDGDLSKQRVLDIGCGAGGWLREFVNWGAKPGNLVGIDALQERIEEARELCSPNIQLICGSAEKLEFENASFDIVMLFMTMSLILESDQREHVAVEALRVLKRTGAILWYDYRYQRPEMKGLETPVTKRQLQRLFPGCHFALKSILPFPPVSRLLAEIWRPAWHLLHPVPLLRTCYVGSITKPLN